MLIHGNISNDGVSIQASDSLKSYGQVGQETPSINISIVQNNNNVNKSSINKSNISNRIASIYKK